MKTKINERLCEVCLKNKIVSLNMCQRCKDLDATISKFIQENPKQSMIYLEKKFKQASKKVRNRFM